MKACPVCHARTFDDAAVCYGCMHRYEGEQQGGTVVAEDAMWEPDDGPQAGFGVVARDAPPAASKAEACASGQDGPPHVEHAPVPSGTPVRRGGSECVRVEAERAGGSACEGKEGGKETTAQPLAAGGIAKSRADCAREPPLSHESRESMLVRVELPEQPEGPASSSASTVFEKTMVLPLAQKRQALTFPLVISIMPARECGMREGASTAERRAAPLSSDGAGGLSLREVVGA